MISVKPHYGQGLHLFQMMEISQCSQQESEILIDRQQKTLTVFSLFVHSLAQCNSRVKLTWVEDIVPPS